MSALAMDNYKAWTFLCRNGKTMAVVLSTPVHTIPRSNPDWTATAWCAVKTIKNFKNGVFSALNRPTVIKACLAEKSNWIHSCYEKEFAPKCLSEDHYVDIKKCFDNTGTVEASADCDDGESIDGRNGLFHLAGSSSLNTCIERCVPLMLQHAQKNITGNPNDLLAQAQGACRNKCLREMK